MQLTKTIEDALAEQRQAHPARVLARQEGSALSRLVSEFSLDDEGSAISRLSRILTATSEQIGKNLTLDDDASSLSRLKRELQATIERLAKSNVEFHSQMREALARLDARKKRGGADAASRRRVRGASRRAAGGGSAAPRGHLRGDWRDDGRHQELCKAATTSSSSASIGGGERAHRVGGEGEAVVLAADRARRDRGGAPQPRGAGRGLRLLGQGGAPRGWTASAATAATGRRVGRGRAASDRRRPRRIQPRPRPRRPRAAHRRGVPGGHRRDRARRPRRSSSRRRCSKTSAAWPKR